MKSEKENYYIKEILKILVQGDIVATGKIASMIALSEKATRNKLEHLQNYLQENQLGSIEKKPRVGIWLSMDEQQKEKMLRLLDGAEHFSVGYDATQRVRETLQIFFRMMPRETITTQKLAEELYQKILREIIAAICLQGTHIETVMIEQVPISHDTCCLYLV